MWKLYQHTSSWKGRNGYLCHPLYGRVIIWCGSSTNTRQAGKEGLATSATPYTGGLSSGVEVLPTHVKLERKDWVTLLARGGSLLILQNKGRSKNNNGDSCCSYSHPQLLDETSSLSLRNPFSWGCRALCHCVLQAGRLYSGA